MGKLTVIYWRDIPAQVVGQKGRTRLKQVLDPRFAAAIDRAAMRAGKGSSTAYLEEWRRESRPCAEALKAAVSAEVSRLEAQFPDDLLESVVKAGGVLNKE